MLLSFLEKYKNTGLLIIRIGVGILFILHGWPKVIKGPELWEKLGESMSLIGINSGFIFWGFMASIAEFLGGILFLTGWLFRPACFFLFFTMLIAVLHHVIKEHENILQASEAIETGFLFLGLMFVGPGKFSFDKK